MLGWLLFNDTISKHISHARSIFDVEN